MLPTIQWNPNTKTATYGFALNGRVLSVLDFLNLIERQTADVKDELWMFISHHDNTVIIHRGYELPIVARFSEYSLQIDNVERNNLYCWMPKFLRQFIMITYPDLPTEIITT